MSTEWLEWVQRLQAISQIGLTFAGTPWDTERYDELREIAIEITAKYSETDQEIIRGLFSKDSWYTTPKVDVRGFVCNDGKVLLVQERSDSLWTVPGGWADVGSTPSNCVESEIKQESGYIAQAKKLIAVHDQKKRNHPAAPFYAYKLIFHCELVGGEPKTNSETLDVDWFDENDLPELSTARITKEQVYQCFYHYRNPKSPTEFD